MTPPGVPPPSSAQQCRRSAETLQMRAANPAGPPTARTCLDMD